MAPMPAGPSPRGASYKADYAVETDRFKQQLHSRPSPFVVGYQKSGHALRHRR